MLLMLIELQNVQGSDTTKDLRNPKARGQNNRRNQLMMRTQHKKNPAHYSGINT